MNRTTSSTRNDRLMQTFNFTEDDLKANRSGEVTHRQRDWIASKRSQHDQKKNLVLYIILGALLIALLVLNGARRNYAEEDFSVIQNVILGLIVFFVVLWAVATVRTRRAQPYFTSVAGSARTEIREFHSQATRTQFLYELHIDRHKFYLPTEEELSAFEDGVTYRVYYVAAVPLQIIISAEMLDSPSQQKGTL